MRSKKLMALTVAPLFAIGMAACETEPAQDDWTTDEGQLPAYEMEPTPYDDPAMQPAPQDTLITPEHPDADLRTQPGVEPGAQPQPDTEPRY
jgi:hypothetical protein